MPHLFFSLIAVSLTLQKSCCDKARDYPKRGGQWNGNQHTDKSSAKTRKALAKARAKLQPNGIADKFWGRVIPPPKHLTCEKSPPAAQSQGMTNPPKIETAPCRPLQQRPVGDEREQTTQPSPRRGQSSTQLPSVQRRNKSQGLNTRLPFRAQMRIGLYQFHLQGGAPQGHDRVGSDR